MDERLYAILVALPSVDLYRERREERMRLRRRCRRQWVALCGVLLGAILLLCPLTLQTLKLRSQGKRLEADNRKLDDQLKALEPEAAQRAILEQRQHRLDKSRAQRLAWEQILAALASCVPDTVCLERVQIAEGDKPDAISVRGAAESMAALRDFTEALARTPPLAKVRLVETNANPTMGPRGVRFLLTFSAGSALDSGEQP